MMLTSACGGNVQNKTIAEANAIIEDLSGRSRQFRTKSRGVKSMRSVLSSSNYEIASELRNVKQMMKEFMQRKAKAKLCGVCESQVHTTLECPHQMTNDQDEQVCGIWESKFENNKPRHSPFSNFYNPASKDHPNLRWRNDDNPPPQFNQSQSRPFQDQQNFQQQYRGPFQQNNQSYNKPQYNAPLQNNALFPQNAPQPNQPNKGPMSTEDLVNSLAQSIQGVNVKVDTMQVNMQSSITNLEMTVGQISSALNRIEAKGNDKFPSQSLPPPNVSVITLRSGNMIDGLEEELKVKVKDVT